MAAGILFPRDAREGPAGRKMTSPTQDENVRGQRDSGGERKDVHKAHKVDLPTHTLLGKRWIGRLPLPRSRSAWRMSNDHLPRGDVRRGDGGGVLAPGPLRRGISPPLRRPPLADTRSRRRATKQDLAGHGEHAPHYGRCIKSPQCHFAIPGSSCMKRNPASSAHRRHRSGDGRMAIDGPLGVAGSMFQ